MRTHQAQGPICLVNGKRVDPDTLGDTTLPEIPEDLSELERSELATLATAYGIDVKKSWSADKLRDEIDTLEDADD